MIIHLSPLSETEDTGEISKLERRKKVDMRSEVMTGKVSRRTRPA